MLKMGIDKVKEMGYKGITVEGNFNFCNKVGFKTSSEYNFQLGCPPLQARGALSGG